ncbi:hypothetical protein Godav_003386 [Gossypium davidsonii]|uniref:Uncharacterized protein n=1 Tax=Gossypium davidsonii TaxID=34287 RepID=A0A7J8SHJ9_GOSDV|nr:hypothetical protein [Gossypium davidsonii]
MELQSACHSFHAPKFKFPNHRRFPFQSNLKPPITNPTLRTRNPRLQHVSKWSCTPEVKKIVCASGSNSNPISVGVEPFRGKSGSVSFHGLTHQLVEENKLMSAPFQEEKGSLLWVLAPVALICSLIVPQFFFSNAIEAFFKDETLIGSLLGLIRCFIDVIAMRDFKFQPFVSLVSSNFRRQIVSSFSFEVMFYIGLGMFLLVTDHVQRPYLQFSAKRWGLITGLKGYLTSAFLSMGFKVIAPLIAVYVTWPVLGFPTLVAVAPFLAGCAAQFAFEMALEKRQSSCWPLVPIIFEVYRLYQLTRATQFIQHFLLLMKDSPRTPEMFERGGALIGMIGTFQALAVVCLWSLMTFLLRLFPSRPVAENY